MRPRAVKDKLAAELRWLGENLTGAVYRCGFAHDQIVFDSYVRRVGDAVHALDRRIATSTYLVGNPATEAASP